ncbi:MAG: hypothetical protein RLZZ15_1793 [Verrucomicrobiota bacterium]|jgi:hypothetical protein
MKSPFTGSWQSIRSSISDYVAGAEWLHFSETDEHIWEVAQPEGKGRPSVTRFTMETIGFDYRFRPIPKPGRPVTEGWILKIERIAPREIAVTPGHGFTTIFRQTEPPTNQAPAPTAPSDRGSI